MAGIPPITCNTNSYFDYDYSFSSLPKDQQESVDPIATLLELKTQEISMNQQIALGTAMADLQAQLDHEAPSFEERK